MSDIDLHPIFRLTDAAFNALNRVATTTPHVFQDGDTDFASILTDQGLADYLEPAGLAGPNLNTIHHRHRQPDSHGLDLHNDIPSLSPQHLADRNLLAWMSCFPLRQYGLHRWPSRSQPGTKREINHAQQHYLAHDQRFMATASIAGRPLWIAELAKRVANRTNAFTTRQAFDLLAGRDDIYGFCVHHEVMRVPEVLTAYIRSIMQDRPQLQTEGARRLAQDLNRAAAGILIDAATREEIEDIIRKSRAAMENTDLMRPPQLDI